MSSPPPPAALPATPQRPHGFPVQLRYCFYLRLSEAKRMEDSATKGRVFRIPADARWVVVPQEYGNGWFGILPLLSDEQVSTERQKGLQADLGRVFQSRDGTASCVLDIPERYPSRLIVEAERTSGEKRRSGQLRLTARAQSDPHTPYAGAQLRYCYYLHLDEAETSTESLDASPAFNIRCKARWVLVRKYLRDGSAQIYKLTSKDKTESGWEKPFHVILTSNVDEDEKKQDLLPKSKKDTWAQCILERYPEHLMRDAEMDYNMTRRRFDLETTRSLFKKIDAGSPEHWTLAKRV
jgi:hypothetical protein